jgi:extracellular elastinolytic metalloproteinase
MLDRVRAARRPGRAAILLGALLALVLTSLPAAGESLGQSGQGGQGETPSFQGESGGLPDVDRRAGRVQPTARQRSLVTGRQADARWNAFGTPRSLTRRGGALASGLPRDAAGAARAWLQDNRELFRLSQRGVASLELLHQARIGKGHAVTFRQRFGGLPAAHDGLVTLAVLDGKVVHVSSSIAGDGNDPGAATVSAADAWRIAAADVGRRVAAADVTGVAQQHGWTRMTVKGFTHPQLARLAALPTAAQGVRPVWETVVLDNEAEPLAFTHFVDARTGAVHLRQNRVDHAQEAPDPAKWKVFPASPRLDYSSADTREVWCWDRSGPDCERVLDNPAARVPWDVNPRTGTSSNTSIGNAARSFENWNTNDPFTVGVNPATPRPGRDYVYPWTNQWFTERCNPDTFTSPRRNDIDAAIANLFAMHNRMHDWSYFLGFTEENFNLQDFNFGAGGAENDPEQGNAQAGGISGGPPTFAARDNANQITFNDGIAPITNMYLWQPIAGGFYAPCVDGDYDMTVIGHEYTHAISNRMVAGPDGDLDGPQAGAMGESWSDLTAMEYLNEYGFVPLANENRFAIGPYVTSDKQAGIRNYGMNKSPLNYSDVAYDLTGPQVHADGEIWSATNFAIRQALIAKYNDRFPAGNAALQRRCADGQRPADRCPGNRRWIQLVFDAYLLMPSQVSMVDARDAYLTADLLRFGGANQATLWNVFASRGFGEGASSNTNADPDPVPSFTSPHLREARVTFRPVDEDGKPIVGQLFVGRYEARAVPVADTDPATPLGNTLRIVPGTYDLIARADGFGMKRLTQRFRSGQARQLRIAMPRNLASAHSGATASGDGVNLDDLIDDTEATNWASLGTAVQGRQVTVRLDPSKPSHQVDRVQVSAHLRPPDPDDPNDPVQSRFSALRRFEVLACEAKAGVDCADDADFAVVFTSPADAFPAIAPRPRAPELIMRSFNIPKTRATHVRLRVLTNQCTGAPDYQGEQDNDPRAATACATASAQALNVRAAELQVFRR